jgi:uncharacterized alkaline shock family protein YloU
MPRENPETFRRERCLTDVNILDELGASVTSQTETSSTTLTGSGIRPSRVGGGGSELETSQGRTTIADNVVQKIAGIAARDVSGVYALGGSGARALGALRERIPGGSQSAGQGVAVEVGEREAAVDLDLVVEYGVSIADLAAAIRRNVITSVERMTGLSVTEVNVAVNDIHLPSDDESPEDEQQPARVQ